MSRDSCATKNEMNDGRIFLQFKLKKNRKFFDGIVQPASTQYIDLNTTKIFLYYKKKNGFYLFSFWICLSGCVFVSK